MIAPMIEDVRDPVPGGAPQVLNMRRATVHALLLAAVARDQLDDPRTAETSIERALELAERDGMILQFTLVPVRELLERHPRHSTAHATLLSTILDVLGGGSPQPARAAAELRDELSDAELRVLRYLPSNLKVPEIAAELFVSANTVRTHLRHIYAKLDTHTRGEAVARARDLGLLIHRRERGGEVEPRRVDALLLRLDDLETEIGRLERQAAEQRAERERHQQLRGGAADPSPQLRQLTAPEDLACPRKQLHLFFLHVMLDVADHHPAARAPGLIVEGQRVELHHEHVDDVVLLDPLEDDLVLARLKPLERPETWDLTRFTETFAPRLDVPQPAPEESGVVAGQTDADKSRPR